MQQNEISRLAVSSNSRTMIDFGIRLTPKLDPEMGSTKLWVEDQENSFFPIAGFDSCEIVDIKNLPHSYSTEVILLRSRLGLLH